MAGAYTTTANVIAIISRTKFELAQKDVLQFRGGSVWALRWYVQYINNQENNVIIEVNENGRDTTKKRSAKDRRSKKEA
jgi:hypothetical protein